MRDRRYSACRGCESKGTGASRPDQPPPDRGAATRRAALAGGAGAPGRAVRPGGSGTAGTPGGRRNDRVVPRRGRPARARLLAVGGDPGATGAARAEEGRRPGRAHPRGRRVPPHHRRGLLLHEGARARRHAHGGGHRRLRGLRADDDVDSAVVTGAAARPGDRRGLGRRPERALIWLIIAPIANSASGPMAIPPAGHARGDPCLAWLPRMDDGQLILAGGALLSAGLIASLVAVRVRVPSLVVFLGVGMFIGWLWIDFDDYELARSVGIVALALILFEGGLNS